MKVTVSNNNEQNPKKPRKPRKPVTPPDYSVDMGIRDNKKEPDKSLVYTHQRPMKVDGESTFLNPAIDSKRKLIDWVMTMLGAPLITIELTESQFDAIIADSIELYTKYAWFGEHYVLLDINNYVPGVGLDTSRQHISAIKDVCSTRDTLYGVAMSDPFFGLNALLNGGNGAGFGYGGGMLGIGGYGTTNGFGVNWTGGFVSYQCAQEFLQLAYKMSGMNPDFSFDRIHQKLILYPEPRRRPHHMHNKPHFKRWILVTCEVEPPLDVLYGNNFVKRMVLAKAKILLGTIRSKFQNVQLLGGGSVDTSIKDEGQTELDKVLEDLRSGESNPNLWFFI